MSVFKKNPGRLQLLLLAGLFGLPLAAAIFLHVSGWRPSGTTNTGVLINPPRPMPAAQFTTPTGTAADWDAPTRKWRLVYVSANGCDDHCRTMLAIARQVRLAQGKERDRVARALLILAPAGSDAAGAVTGRAASNAPAENDLAVLQATPAAVAGLRAAFQPPRAAKSVNGLFLVDPLRNVMMYYPPDADPSGMRKDLKRLLQVSQIG